MERTFAYTYMPAELDGPHTFFVASDPLPASGNRFEMGLEELNGDSVRVTIAKHYTTRKRMRRRGFPKPSSQWQRGC